MGGGSLQPGVSRCAGPSLDIHYLAPAANEMERHALRFIGGRLGFVEGHFTSGGAEANHTAVVAALASHFPGWVADGARGEPVLYVSEEGHHSLLKIAGVTAVGRRAVRMVPTDGGLRMDVSALRSMVRSDREQGLHPFMVVGTAGTTSAGVVDPRPLLAGVCREEGLWLHVDAAWGGAAALSPLLRPVLDGIGTTCMTPLSARAPSGSRSTTASWSWRCRHWARGITSSTPGQAPGSFPRWWRPRTATSGR